MGARALRQATVAQLLKRRDLDPWQRLCLATAPPSQVLAFTESPRGGIDLGGDDAVDDLVDDFAGGAR